MIFLSYASEDRDRVLPYYDILESHGLEPWMDCKKLVGGQNWDYEIKTALDRSDLIVVFVSANSVDKRGYAQREIKFVIDKHDEKLVDDIYIIPVQLDAGDFPHLLKGIQFIQASDDDAFSEVLRSIEASSQASKIDIDLAQAEAEVHWATSTTESAYNGIPGYRTRTDKLRVSSTKYLGVKEIIEHLNGELAGMAMQTRISSLHPDSESFNLMQNEWTRTHTFDAIFDSANVIGRVFSVRYILSWYYGGAAHPTHSTKTFNYLLDPIVHLENAASIFLDDTKLSFLQNEVRLELVKELADSGFSDDELDWIAEGTKTWDEFSNFYFSREGLSFQFSSYQVAPYAAGMPLVTVPYDKLKEHFADHIVYALDLYR